MQRRLLLKRSLSSIRLQVVAELHLQLNIEHLKLAEKRGRVVRHCRIGLKLMLIQMYPSRSLRDQPPSQKYNVATLTTIEGLLFAIGWIQIR